MRNNAPSGDFKPMNLFEVGRLALIVGCSALVAFAGFYSQADASKSETKSVVVGRNLSADERFARAQINGFERMLSELTERAELEANPQSAVKMRAALIRLGEQLDSTKRHMDKLQRSAAASDRAFTKEDMRGSLLALQDAGAKAVSLFVDADLKTGGQKAAGSSSNPKPGVVPASFNFSTSNELGSDRTP